jgi:hypothetical protein
VVPKLYVNSNSLKQDEWFLRQKTDDVRDCSNLQEVKKKIGKILASLVFGLEATTVAVIGRRYIDLLVSVGRVAQSV